MRLSSGSWRRWQACVLGLIVAPLFSLAASAAAISGSVKDQTGRGLPAALVELTSPETGFSQTVETDEQGRFRFSSLPAGAYRLTAAMPGFQKEARAGLNLAIGQDLLADFALRVGSLSEEVTVVDSGDAVDLATAEISSLVDAKQVSEMPLNGRDWITLSALSPGVVRARSVGNQSSSNTPTGRISVGGQRPAATNFVYDGVDMNVYSTIRSPGGVADGSALGLEAVKEFRIVTTNYSAEHGLKSGGLVELVSKSGTNELRGSAYLFHRDAAFDARDFFDPGGETEFGRDQFGVSVGGPIVKNRTFIFANYEGLREHKAQTSSGVTPTEQARSGVLPAAGGGVETVAVDPRVIPFLDLYPLPNGQDFGNGTGLWSGKALREIREHYWTVRLDHNFTDNNRLFVRYSMDDGSALLPFAASDFPGFPRTPDGRDHLVAIGFTHYHSAALLNDLTVGFNRSDRGADFVVLNPGGLSFSLLPGSPFGSLRVAGLGALGNSTRPVSDLLQNIYQFADSVTAIKRRHSLKFGVEYRRFQINTVQELNTNGVMTFSSLRAFLENKASSFRGVAPPADFHRGLRFSQYAFYAQDKLSLFPRLTLNLGLRYEPWSNVSDVNGRISVLLNPLTATGAEDFRVAETLFVQNPSLGNLAPRVGLAWDPFGKGTTSIRGGAGIYYDCPYNGGLFSVVTAAPPFVNAVVVNNPGFPDILGQGTQPQKSLAPTLLEYDGQKWPSILQYHLTVQQQLPWDSILSVGWVGARGIHLESRRELNSRVPQILEDGRKYFPAKASRKNPDFSSMVMLAMDARSWYDSLQVSWTRRYGGGVTVASYYTLGKAIDEASPTNTTLEVSGGPMIRMDSDDLRRDKGLGVFDVRHSLSASFLWDSPFARGSGAWWRPLLREWQIGGFLTLASGHPFTPMISFNNSRNGVSGSSSLADRPDLRAGFDKDPVVGKVEQWYNPKAFALPQAGFFGNLGRDTVTGPPFKNLDFLVTRDFRVSKWSEGVKLQLRAEFFNVLNHPNFDLPGESASAEASSYVFTDSTGEPNMAAAQLTRMMGNSRQAQFGVKVLW